jgi:hypothetical protein
MNAIKTHPCFIFSFWFIILLNNCAGPQRFPEPFANLLADNIGVNAKLTNSQAKYVCRELDATIRVTIPRKIRHVMRKDPLVILNMDGKQALYLRGEGWRYYSAGHGGTDAWDLRSKFWLGFENAVLAAHESNNSRLLIEFLDGLKDLTAKSP